MTADEANGVREPEAAFDHEVEEMSPHDARAEEIARARGMPEDLIAMIKEGLRDSREGRVVSSNSFSGFRKSMAGEAVWTRHASLQLEVYLDYLDEHPGVVI